MRSVASIFRDSVGEYLKAVQPEYEDGRFRLFEHELQGFFLARLISRGGNVRAERNYPGSKNRYDVLIKGSPDIYIEIEWDAKWTDGFGKRTFKDADKLDEIGRGDHGMFLAVNVSNKWTSWPKRPQQYDDPEKLPTTKKGKGTALRRYWSEAAANSLVRCRPRLWMWEYPYARKCNVLVLTCHGVRTKTGWKSPG